MPRFASPEWIAALDAAARADATLAAIADPPFALSQVVDGDPGSSWTLRLGPGGASVEAGRAADAAVTITGDERTVAAIARGDESAQEAFLDGRLRLGGDIDALLAHAEALAALGDVFAAVRAHTEW